MKTKLETVQTINRATSDLAANLGNAQWLAATDQQKLLITIEIIGKIHKETMFFLFPELIESQGVKSNL